MNMYQLSSFIGLQFDDANPIEKLLTKLIYIPYTPG